MTKCFNTFKNFLFLAHFFRKSENRATLRTTIGFQNLAKNIPIPRKCLDGRTDGRTEKRMDRS